MGCPSSPGKTNLSSAEIAAWEERDGGWFYCWTVQMRRFSDGEMENV